MSGGLRERAAGFLALSVLLLVATRAGAFEKAGRLGDVEYRLICSDRALLKEKINVLVILDLPPGVGEGRMVRAELVCPEEAFSPADGAAGLAASLRVEPGQTRRFAFRGLRANEAAGPATHTFRLTLSAGDGDPEVAAFEVETIRGPLVPRGPLSVLVPALLSLLAIPAFVLFLRRRGEPGGWRKVKDPELEPPEVAWWEDEEATNGRGGKS